MAAWVSRDLDRLTQGEVEAFKVQSADFGDDLWDEFVFRRLI